MKKKRWLGVFVAGIILITNVVPCFAASKTAIGLENNTPSGTSDAESFVNGIKNYDSAYSKTYKSPSNVSASDFWSKAHTIKYWSSHGSNSGRVWGADNNVDINIFNQAFSWAGGELEFAFLAACRQLDGLGSNPRSRYANAMIGDNAVRTICGYHESAPASIDKDVADKFIAYARTGESVKSSWILANQFYQNQGYSTGVYCVLTHSGNVQYSRFPGFPGNTYTRPGASSTTILRFSSANPNGTTQPLSIGDLTESCDIEVPTYVLSEMPVDIKAENNNNMIVLKDDDSISLIGGEVGDTEVGMTEDRALSYYKEQFNKHIANFEEIKTDAAIEIVSPIVMAEVNLEGGEEEEVPVAYNVVMQNTYDGYEILGNYISGIVDDSSVISISGNWGNFEKIDISESSDVTDYNTAYELVVKSGVLAEAKLLNYKLAFALNESTGYYEPTWIFNIDNGSTCQINCLNEIMSIIE